MIATYKGKVILSNQPSPTNSGTISRTHDQVDQIIANDTRWIDVVAGGRNGPLVSSLVYDDGQPVTETIAFNEVPQDADSWIVQEPAFYYQ